MNRPKKLGVHRGGKLPVLHIRRKDGKTLCGIDTIASMNYDLMTDSDKEWLCSSCKKAIESHNKKQVFFPDTTNPMRPIGSWTDEDFKKSP